MPAFDPRDLASLEEALWTALGSDLAPGQRRALVSRLLASPEFQKLRLTWKNRVRAQSDSAAGGGIAPDLPAFVQGYGGSTEALRGGGKVGGDDAGFVRV